MADETKPKDELEDELALLRQRVAELESAKATHDETGTQLMAMTAGLRTVAAAADELMACDDLDTLFRRAVELAREQLGLARCSIYLEKDGALKGTYGTDRRGATTDENTCRYPTELPELRSELGSPHLQGQRWIATDQAYLEWDGEKFVEFGEGWVVLTPIQSPSGDERVGVFFNDAGTTSAALVESKQDLVAVYCSLLANVIAQKKAARALEASEKHYRGLFEDAPISLWEEDLSQVKEYVDNLRESGVEDLVGYFREHPTELAECEQLRKVTMVNKATLDLFRASDTADLLCNARRILPGVPQPGFSPDVRCIALREKSCGGEIVGTSVDGEQLQLSMAWSVARGEEDTYAKVYYSLIDITARKSFEKERESLIEELTDALERVETLRGLIPICSSCKRIRDDKGFWQQVEIYVQDHSEAQFTHGLCPECSAKLYGISQPDEQAP